MVETRKATVLLSSLTGVAVAAALCLPSGVASAANESVTCGSGAVVIVGGTYDAESVLLNPLKDRYTAQGYEVINADYPATIWPLGATGYDASTQAGIASTAAAIARYQQHCDQPVVVAGYSQGARIAGDVLADIGNGRSFDVNGTPDDPSDDVLLDPDKVSGELYADPRQAGDKTGRGIELSLIGIIPGLTMSGPRGQNSSDRGFGELNDRVVSVCVDGDPICDLPDPIHDPIGAIDGLLGYQTKHFLYPQQMAADPFDPDFAWTTRAVECEEGVCTVQADSAFAELLAGWARSAGYTGPVGDFLTGRPTLDLPFGIELANLQPLTQLAQGLLPPLPQLGYGAYLPDLFVFEDILQGIVTLSPPRFLRGVTALAASVRSIVLLPLNFVRHWAGALVGPQASPQTTPPMAAVLASQEPGPGAVPGSPGTEQESSPTTAGSTVVETAPADEHAGDALAGAQGDDSDEVEGIESGTPPVPEHAEPDVEARPDEDAPTPGAGTDFRDEPEHKADADGDGDADGTSGDHTEDDAANEDDPMAAAASAVP